MQQKNESLILPESPISGLFMLPFIGPEQKRLLLKFSDSITLAKQSFLFSEGEVAQSFYLILNGAIKLIKQTSASDDETTVIDVLGRGELIGVALMLDADVQRVYPISAKTLGPVEVLRFAKETFHNIWLQDPQLLELANKSIIKRMEIMQKDRCIQKFTLEKKVAYFMTEKWIACDKTRITRKDIADCIGASQEAVIRLLHDWSQKKWIINDNHEIEIRDIQTLRALWRS